MTSDGAIGDTPAQIARRLMRLARTAAMATLTPETGAPLTTLVGVASDEDGAPLLLLSSLAAHSKNLANDPRASILIGAPAVARRSAQRGAGDAERPP